MDGSRIMYAFDDPNNPNHNHNYQAIKILDTKSTNGISTDTVFELSGKEVRIISDLTLNTNIYFQICSNNMKIRGWDLQNRCETKRNITIKNLVSYKGLFSNPKSNSKSNIQISNLNIKSDNSTISNGAGWLCQSYFGNSTNYIYKCSSNGLISPESGGLIGSHSSANVRFSYTTGQNSLNVGAINTCGGIFGKCASDSSVEFSYTESGSIFAGNDLSDLSFGKLSINNCYSKSSLFGPMYLNIKFADNKLTYKGDWSINIKNYSPNQKLFADIKISDPAELNQTDKTAVLNNLDYDKKYISFSNDLSDASLDDLMDDLMDNSFDNSFDNLFDDLFDNLSNDLLINPSNYLNIVNCQFITKNEIALGGASFLYLDFRWSKGIRYNNLYIPYGEFNDDWTKYVVRGIYYLLDNGYWIIKGIRFNDQNIIGGNFINDLTEYFLNGASFLYLDNRWSKGIKYNDQYIMGGNFYNDQYIMGGNFYNDKLEYVAKGLYYFFQDDKWSIKGIRFNDQNILNGEFNSTYDLYTYDMITYTYDKTKETWSKQSNGSKCLDAFRKCLGLA